jgi:hypothetical protein
MSPHRATTADVRRSRFVVSSPRSQVRRACRLRLPAATPPAELAVVQGLHRSPIAGFWFPAPTATFTLSGRPMSCSRRELPGCQLESRALPSQLHLSLEDFYCTLPNVSNQGVRPLPRRSAPFMRLLAPSAHEGPRVHQTQAYRTCFVPPPPSFTTLAACSTPTRTGCFAG